METRTKRGFPHFYSDDGGLVTATTPNPAKIRGSLYRGGLNYMRYSVSDTAEHGDYTDGTYARNWIKENETGRKWFQARRENEQELLIEKVDAKLRSMMPFLSPVTTLEP